MKKDVMITGKIGGKEKTKQVVEEKKAQEKNVQDHDWLSGF